MERMIEYEKYHLNTENRMSGRYLDVLHCDYEEFGQSGKIYRKHDLPQSELDNSNFEIDNFTVIDLSDTSRLCKYHLHNITDGTSSIRSSVWVLCGEEWKMIFHQGTPVR